MNVFVSQVRKGDYVDGFGTVTDIHKFYKDRAVKSRTCNPLKAKKVFVPNDEVYARIVAEQQEESYDSVLDNVVLSFLGGSKRSFSADKEVKVYRISKVAI